MDNLFLFFGDDTYSLRQKVELWKREFIKKHGGDINLEVLDGSRVDAPTIESASSAIPFLGEKRLVIVEDYLSSASLEDQKLIAESLERLPASCVLVFVESTSPDGKTTLVKRLKKYGNTVEFPLLTGGKLLAWIQKEVKACGSEIEEKASIRLTELIGGDLHKMHNEIQKLAGYAENRKITEQDIALLIDTTLATSIFNFTDALSSKNLKRCVAILHQLIDSGEDLHRILFMIIRQFRYIIQVKDFLTHGVSKNTMITKLNVNPFVVTIALNQCSNFDFDSLRFIYDRLLALDSDMKSGKVKVLAGDNRELTLALDRLLLAVCNK